MLMEISKLITPEVYEVIYNAGHFDEILIADANYKGSAMSDRIVQSIADKNDELLDVILNYLPLDEDENENAIVMIPDHGYDHEPEIWKEYEKVLKKNGYQKSVQLMKVNRKDFYIRTKKAFATIKTNDIRLYADLIIVKGFVVE